VEAAKEDYEHFKEQIEHYDELISETIPEFEKNIRDNLNKRIEIQVSKFKMSVEIELDLAKAEKDWNKFRKKVINQIRQDDILGNTKALFEDLATYYSDGGLNVIGALTNQLNGTLDQLHQIDTFGTSSVYGDNKSKAVEDLKTFLDELISNLEDVEDLIDEIENSIFDAIDKAQDAFDDQVDTFEHISDVLDHNVKLVKMLYGE
jgi:ABC-type transporter Mla subunit MlaD